MLPANVSRRAARAAVTGRGQFSADGPQAESREAARAARQVVQRTTPLPSGTRPGMLAYGC